MSVVFPQSASITLRLVTGSALSYNQMDTNWSNLQVTDQNIINVIEGAAYTGSSNTFTEPQLFLDNVGITGSLLANWAIFNGQVVSNFPGVGFNGTASWALNTVGGGGGGVGTLQQVTTAGNTTNLGINITNGNLLVKGINVSSSIADLYTGSGGTSINVSTYLSSSWTASFNAFTSSYRINSASFSASIADLYTMSFTPTNVSTYLSSSWTASYQINSASFSASIADLYTSSVSSSYALTASYFLTSSVSTASYVATASTAISSSNALTASYFFTSSVSTASYVATASTAISSSNALTASYIDVTGSGVLINWNGSTLQLTASKETVDVSTYLSSSWTASYNTGSWLGNVNGTASWSNNSLTASYFETSSVSTASYLNTLNQDVILTGSLNILGNINATNLYVLTITSSTEYISGSTKFGSLETNTHQFTGSVTITGSLEVTNGITGSLLGTSSYSLTASFVESSSYALTASYINITGSGIIVNTGSFGVQLTASISSADTLQAVTTAGNITTASVIFHTASIDIQTVDSPVSATVSGSGTLTIGTELQATAPGAIALGVGSQATQQYAVAQGYFALASGDSAFAHGDNVIAQGSFSHAEGGSTVATGQYSHAEGFVSEANHSYAHAEGNYTKTGKDFQHVEGQFNIVDPAALWVVGDGFDDTNRHNLIAVYPSSDGILNDGKVTITGSLEVASITGSLFGTASYALEATTASYVELAQTASVTLTAQTASYVDITGSGVIVNYNGSQIQLTGSAQANVSFSFQDVTTVGNQTSASIFITGSLANGIDVQALGTYSHAEGQFTTAVNNASHAEGELSVAIGAFSHAEGANTTTIGNYSHTEGQQTTTIGAYSHAQGLGTIALKDHQLVAGQYNVPDSNALFVVGDGANSFINKNVVAAYPGKLTVTGSLNVSRGITGSLFGTSSWALSSSRATTSSYALTSSYITNNNLAVLSVYSTQDQTLPVSQQTTMSFNNALVEDLNGLRRTGAGNNQILIAETGIYNFQFSVQVNDASGNGVFYVWFAKNGTNIADSNTSQYIKANEPGVLALNFVDSFLANDVVELRWGSTNSSTLLDYIATPTYGPAIPSVILTVTQIK